VDFLGVEFLGEGGTVRDISEQHGHGLALAFDGAPGRENPVG
jgi:hypothetical protein